MTKLDEIQNRRKKLLKMLSEQESITLEACMCELNIGLRTLLSDIADLRSQNYEIKRKKNTISGSNISSFNTYEHSSRAIARQASILRFFQKNPGSPQREDLLYNKIFKNINSPDEISGKTFHKDIKTLIEQGYLTRNKDKTLSSTLKVYTTKNFSSADSDQMLTHLYNYSYGDAMDPIADNLIKKISRELYYKLCTDTNITYTPYYTFKKKYPGDLSKAFSIFQSCDFYHHILQLRYEPEDLPAEEFLFRTGKLVYSMNQSKLYAMGKDDSGTLRLLNFEYITSSAATDHPNLEYNAREYDRICREMFSVSVEKPFQVKIFFKDELQILNKVRCLQASRPSTSSLKEYQNGVLYQDTIRGFYDFARYLRGFGRSCKVIEPQCLRENLIASAQRLSEEYRQILNKENL